MDDNKRIRRQINLIWAALLTLIVMSFANLYLALFSPGGGFYPSVIVKEGPKGDKGETAAVDYRAIALIVNEQVKDAIGSLPKPRNGVNGTNGTNGVNGTNGQDAVIDYDKLKGMISDEVFTLEAPQPRVPEFRVNPANGNLEKRFVGDGSWQILLKSDDLWQIFLQKCQAQNMCPAP